MTRTLPLEGTHHVACGAQACPLPAHLRALFLCALPNVDTRTPHTRRCERLFSSPIPPNMARHGMRSVTLWIAALPIVLAPSMPPLLVALWTASTAYIYLGVDELGAQVEQPFTIMPLWQLCHLAQLNVEETLSTPDLPLRLNQKSAATPSPLGCQSGLPFESF